ncbi:MAG TPA: S-adenosylmethionine decarboxylase [Chlamydiales bacterium]|nr:S-adenosylmethionine decarboxylase [Chlamydiales bacterium]
MEFQSNQSTSNCACIEPEAYWGYHLILDCKECDVNKIKDAENIRFFVQSLVQEIDMKAFGEPLIEHFGSHNPVVSGYSLMQLIETSSITGHFAEGSGDAYLDIFSCKPYDIEIAKAVVRRFFNPQKIKITYLTRQA